MIMDTMNQSSSSCVPPGFRFHPTDEELVGYYLRKKVASQKIDLDVIRDIDLYRIEPWDLIEICRIGYEEQNEWYFFSHKDKKYPTGTRTNRATMAGFWKATGRDKAVYEKLRLIGMRKTLVFYKGRAPNGQKTDWIMHEYRLESQENIINNGPPQEEGWVVCRAFKKRTTGQTRTAIGWESKYLYDESSQLVTSPMCDRYTTIQPPSNIRLTQSFMCKQELELASQNLNFVQCDEFIQLPQLESSPPLQSLKRPAATSSSIMYDQLEDNNNIIIKKRMTNNDQVRDWRDLDKFVASQLSQEEEIIRCSTVGEGFSTNFEENVINDSASLNHMFYQGVGGGGERKMNGLLSSSDHFDVGICIFDSL